MQVNNWYNTKLYDANGNPLTLDDAGQLQVTLDGIVDADNSSKVLLNAGQTFTGIGKITLPYSIIFVSVYSNVASANNGFVFEMSSDGINWLAGDKYTIIAAISNSFSFQPSRKYFRIKYTNGGTNQASFDLETILKKSYSKPSSHRIQEAITTDDDAELTKSVITGVTPSGIFINFSSSEKGNFKVALDEYPADAFGRLRVSEPHTIFDNSQIYDASNALFWSGLAKGTGTRTFDNATSKQTLAVGAVAGDYYIYQTKERFKYQPGKSHEILITGLWNTEAGVIKRGGLVDVDNINLVTISQAPQNGIFFENNAGVLSFNIANNGTVTETAIQTNWNIDKMLGTGISGFTLNIENTNIIFIDLEWLGVGNVRCGFVSKLGGIAVCHEFKHASFGFLDVYMRTPNLPVHYSIISTGSTGSMKAICSSVISEGGYNSIGVLRTVPNTIVSPSYAVLAGATELIVGFRLKRNSYDASLIPLDFNAMNKSDADCIFLVCYNPTYAGAVTWVDVANSNIQYAVNNNNAVSAKNIILAAQSSPSREKSSSSAGSSIESSLRVGRDLAGVMDEIWLVCEAINNSDVLGFITLRDVI